MTSKKLPLEGIRVLEFAGLAPGPFAGLLLSDYGATVLRIDRPPTANPATPTRDLLTRNKYSLALNLKSPSSIALLHKLIANAKIDVLIDPFRPGVLEKLNLGPNVLCTLNPRLIYARITGFRREGKYKDMAGHDINYLAVSGALDVLGRRGEKPYAPVNVLADFAGGGAMLVTGILLALFAREKTGKGQVVEGNMVDGVNYLFTFPRLNGAGGGGWGKAPLSMWYGPRGENLLDGGAPFYDAYETKDGGYMAVGCLEPQFYDVFVRLLFEGKSVPSRTNPSNWTELRRLITERFKSKTRTEWEKIFDGTDACVTPVMSFAELEEQDSNGINRSPIYLKATPGRDISNENGGLCPGDGGEYILTEWCGWRRGKEFDFTNGVCELRESKARL